MCGWLGGSEWVMKQEGFEGNMAWWRELDDQLLSSSSVAVSTSHDFEDKATITAFCLEEKDRMLHYISKQL